MKIDMSKRVCDASLGEFVAAERTIGILTGWIEPAIIILAVLAWRFASKRIGALLRRRQDPPIAFAWYWGDSLCCRRCNRHDDFASQHDHCRGCMYAGREQP